MANPTHRFPLVSRIGLGFACLVGATVSATGQAPQVRSEVKALAIVAVREIPKAPPNPGERNLCSHLTAKPVSEPAHIVAGQGWTVTGEVRLASGEQAVSFAGRFEPGTSGSCLVSEGNVAIFRDGALLAIAYAPKGANDTIGQVLPLADGQARIWSGDYLRQPLADLRVEDGTVALVPLAAQEVLCGGRAVVPNIYGLSIDKARKLLEAKGWTPLRGEKPAPESREADLVKLGIVEVDSCSGTGFGFCSFGYKGPGGGLSVTTVGDGEYPAVSGYDAACK